MPAPNRRPGPHGSAFGCPSGWDWPFSRYTSCSSCYWASGPPYLVSESPKPRSRPRRHLMSHRPVTIAAWLAPAVLAGCGLVLVYAVDPRTPGNYPPCLFLFVTGCYCPGCGTLRTLHSLLHGDPHTAIGYNLLTIGCCPSCSPPTLTASPGWSLLSESQRCGFRPTWHGRRWCWSLRFGPCGTCRLNHLPHWRLERAST